MIHGRYFAAALSPFFVFGPLSVSPSASSLHMWLISILFFLRRHPKQEAPPSSRIVCLWILLSLLCDKTLMRPFRIDTWETRGGTTASTAGEHKNNAQPRVRGADSDARGWNWCCRQRDSRCEWLIRTPAEGRWAEADLAKRPSAAFYGSILILIVTWLTMQWLLLF